MPKEKNSAASAICPAVSAARGTSIIVPISASTLDAGLAATSASTSLGLVADDLELLDGADQRDHDLRLRVAARAFCAAAAASAIARDLHARTGRG